MNYDSVQGGGDLTHASPLVHLHAINQVNTKAGAVMSHVVVWILFATLPAQRDSGAISGVYASQAACEHARAKVQSLPLLPDATPITWRCVREEVQ
jgi:hypothetical protein